MKPQEHRGTEPENHAEGSEKKELETRPEMAGDLESRDLLDSEIKPVSKPTGELPYGDVDLVDNIIVDADRKILSQFQHFGFFPNFSIYGELYELNKMLSTEPTINRIFAEGNQRISLARYFDSSKVLIEYVSEGLLKNSNFHSLSFQGNNDETFNLLSRLELKTFDAQDSVKVTMGKHSLYITSNYDSVQILHSARGKSRDDYFTSVRDINFLGRDFV